MLTHTGCLKTTHAETICTSANHTRTVLVLM